MKRKLTVVVIDGVEFYVDVQRDGLWQTDCPDNWISFDFFHAVDNGYCFIYNKKTRSAAWDGSYIKAHRDQHCIVTLPALMELDPEGMALRYEIPLEMLTPDTLPKPPKRVTAALRPLNRFL